MGNHFQGTILNAISLSRLDDHSRNLLVANNTTLDCRTALVVFNTKIKGTNIQVRNNLVLALPLRLPEVERLGGSLDEVRPGGRATSFPRRGASTTTGGEVKEPAAGSKEATAWIPPTRGRLRRDHIEVLSRDARSDDFLRPAVDSPVATEGPASPTRRSRPRRCRAAPRNASLELESHLDAATREGRPHQPAGQLTPRHSSPSCCSVAANVRQFEQ